MLMSKKSTLNIANKISRKDVPICSREDLLSLVRWRADQKNSSVCHIIGSGWSLNDSCQRINKNDFVIGFNFSALLKLQYDLYFVEFGGEKVADIAERHIALVDQNVLPCTDLIFFKNMWEDKNDPEFILKHWAPRAKLIKDFFSPCLKANLLDQALSLCLEDKSDFLPQYCSTAITSIFVAYFAGFKDIVLHGVDFGGNYFFEEPSFVGDLKYAPPSKGQSSFYAPTMSSTTVHSTAAGEVGMKSALPILSALLKGKGVALYSASSSSPLSKVLPVYDA